MKSLWAAALVLVSMATMLAGGATAQEYRLRPGDVLRVEVLEDPSLNRDVLVPPDGRIAVPLAGSVPAGGRTVDQIRSSLTSALASNFATSPTVFVGITSLAERKETTSAPAPEPEPITYSIYLLGEVANPGRVEVEPGTTILQVFALAGGFSDFAATKRIQLRRNTMDGEKIYPLSYDAIMSGRSPNGQVKVAEGDTFIVPVRRLFE